MATPLELGEEYSYLLSPLSLAVTATASDPRPYEYAEHLHLLSMEIVKLCSRDKGWPRRLLVTMPPRHGKSELCSHWTPVWNMALRPWQRVVLTSYEAEFAREWGYKVRESVRNYYPILQASVVEDTKAAHRWKTKAGGGMITAGVRGPITGKGGHILICDDPIKNAEEANSPTIRDAIWEWYKTTFITREEPIRDPMDETVVILIMTRWHEDDLAGRILESDGAEFWRHIDLAATCEDPALDPLERPKDAALWPEKWDELKLANKKLEIGPYAYAALFQQHPAPVEGQGINRMWWRYYEPGKDDCPRIDEFDQIIQSWDPTFKDVASADFCVGQVWGRLGNECYLLDVWRDRANLPATLNAIRAMCEKWPRARPILVEETAVGPAICDTLEKEFGYVARINPRGQKHVRLHWGTNNAAAVIERGQVYLPRGGHLISADGKTDLVKELVKECAAFPNAKNDDLVDAMSQAIGWLLPRTWVWESQQARLRNSTRVETPVDALREQIRESVARKIKRAKREDLAQQSSLFPGL